MRRRSIFQNQLSGPGGIRELLQIALPLVMSQACETLMMFTDRLFLSRLGPAEMSAALGGGLSCFMFMTFFLGLTGFANALVAQHLGAGRPKSCPVVATQALLVAVIAYPFVLGMIPLGQLLFRKIGISPEQLAPQQDYFRILMCGAILVLLRNSLSAYFSGIGRTRVIMISAIVSMVVNIGANYLLIFGKLGLPALGIRGAAYGTIIGSAAGFLVVAAVYFSRRNREQFAVLAGFRFNPVMMKKLLRLGYPSGLEFFLNLTAFNLLVLTFHSYGLAVASAVTIAFNWDIFSFIPLLGINISVTSLVGRYMGARDVETAHRSTLSGLKLVLCYSSLIMVLFSTLAPYLVDVFRPAAADAAFAATRPLAIYMVRLVSLYVCADAIGVVFSGALRGAGDTFMTMVLSVASHWFMVAVTLPLVHIWNVDPHISWAVAVGMIWVIGLTFFFRYRSGKWKRLQIVDAPDAGEG